METEARRVGALDTVRNAADLALLGILTTVGSLGVVTAGAAVATASAAVHDWHGGDQAWPSLRVTLRRYVQGLLPGIVPASIAVVGGVLLTLNLSAITRGVVPGGAPLAIATIALMAAAIGYAGIVIVEVGRQGGTGWRAAAGSAYRIAHRRPAALLANAGVIALVIALALMIIPVLTPVLTGYTILALHAVTRRLAPTQP